MGGGGDTARRRFIPVVSGRRSVIFFSQWILALVRLRRPEYRIRSLRCHRRPRCAPHDEPSRPDHHRLIAAARFLCLRAALRIQHLTADDNLAAASFLHAAVACSGTYTTPSIRQRQQSSTEAPRRPRKSPHCMGNTAARQVSQHRLAQPHFRVALQQRYGTVKVPRVRCSTNPSINRALCLPSRSFTE